MFDKLFGVPFGTLYLRVLFTRKNGANLNRVPLLSTLAPTVCLSARFNCVSSSHARTGERREARIVPSKPHNDIKQGHDLCESGGGLFILYVGPDGHDEKPMFDKAGRCACRHGVFACRLRARE